VTFTEVYEGFYGSRDPRQAEQVFRTFLAAVTVIPYNRRVGLRTARLRAALRANKLPVDHRSLDLVIAATALEYALTLVSSNMRDYQDILGLNLLNPRTPR
jgi:predicted nucleic acid-binding protein